jgi:hypothetical protein
MECFFAFTDRCRGEVQPARGSAESAGRFCSSVDHESGYCVLHRAENLRRASWRGGLAAGGELWEPLDGHLGETGYRRKEAFAA